MKSVILSQPLILAYYTGTIFQVDSKGPDTQLGDMTFQETSNIIMTNDTTIVSFTEENIVIRTHLLMNQ